MQNWIQSDLNYAKKRKKKKTLTAVPLGNRASGIFFSVFLSSSATLQLSLGTYITFVIRKNYLNNLMFNIAPKRGA